MLDTDRFLFRVRCLRRVSGVINVLIKFLNYLYLTGGWGYMKMISGSSYASAASSKVPVYLTNMQICSRHIATLPDVAYF